MAVITVLARRTRHGSIRRKGDPSAPNFADFGEVEVVLYQPADAAIGSWYIKVGQVPPGVSKAALALTGTIDGSRQIAQTYTFVPLPGQWVYAGTDRSFAATPNTIRVHLEAIDFTGRRGRSNRYSAFRVSNVLEGVVVVEPIVAGVLPAFTLTPMPGGDVGTDPGTVYNDRVTTTVTLTFEGADSTSVLDVFSTGADPEPEVDAFQINDPENPEITEPTPVVPVDGRWPDEMPNYVRIKRTINDPSLAEPIVDYSVWTLVIHQPVAVPEPPVVSFGASVARYSGYCTPTVSFINLSAVFPGLTIGDLDVQWTTSGQSPIPDAHVQSVVVGGQIYMTDPSKRVDPNLGGIRQDEAVFAYGGIPAAIVGTTEIARSQRLRFRWRVRRIGNGQDGPWSNWTSQLVVQPPTGTTGQSPYKWPHDWVPIISRTEAAAAALLVDGPGFQFLRDFARTFANTSRLLMPLDINGPRESVDSFGARIVPARWEGMYVARSGVSAYIDPHNEMWQALLYSAASQIVDAAFDAQAGFYLSQDGGKTATLTLPLPGLMASTSAGYRHNYRCIAHRPGNGVAASGRTIVVVANKRTKQNTNVVKQEIWRSNAGGQAGSWEMIADLPVATYASGDAGIYGIGIAPNGDYYIWGRRGAWRSPAGANVGTVGTWARITSLPDGIAVHHMDVGAWINTGTPWAGEVWAGVAGRGLWRAQDGVSFAQDTALGNVDVRSFDVAPTDRNYIAVVSNGNNPRYTHNGFGGPWTVIKSAPRLGQDDTFSHNLNNGDHYGVVCKLDDRNTWFFHRGQHFGISTDGAANVVFAGHFMDGTHTHSFGYHPTDWETWGQAQQDRSFVYTETAGDWWWQDKIIGPNTPAFTADLGGATNKGTLSGFAVAEDVVDFLASHTLTCTTPGASAVFSVTAADGTALGTATIGVACTLIPGVSFTLTNGTAYFVTGDRFTVAPAPSWAIVTAINNDQHISGGGTIITPGGRVISMQGNGNGNRVPVIMTPRDGHPIGDVRVKMSCNASTLSEWAELDPNDTDRAFMGKYRVTDIDGDVEFAAMDYHFIGLCSDGGVTHIYGITKDKADRNIYTSADGGATWSLWVTAVGSFRPIDNTPMMAPARQSFGTMYAVRDERYLVQITGAGETIVFDAVEYLTLAGHAGNPKPCVYGPAVAWHADDYVALSLYAWGVPNVYTCRNPLGARWTRKTGAVGNGSVTGLAAGAGAMVGRYVARFIGSGTWEVRDPTGAVLAPATTGVAYAGGGLGMTIGAGGTPWAIGDEVYLWPRVTFDNVSGNLGMVAGKVFFAQHSDDLKFGAEIGTHALPAPADYRATHGINHSYADRAREYLEKAL